MNLLVDTDVLLDLALGRSPHEAPARLLFDALQSGAATGFLAWHSVANFHYLVAPRAGGAATRTMLLEMLRFMEVASTLTDSVRYAARLPMRDFEDALQAAAAVACGASFIVTRNLKDYSSSPVPARTPASLLPTLGG